MATRKTEQKGSRKKKDSPIVKADEEKKGGFLNFFRLGESYTSLILGVIVVIIATILLLSFLYQRNTDKEKPQQETKNTSIEEEKQDATPIITESVEQEPTAMQSEEKKQIGGGEAYTVKKGETLWQIAEKIYNDGSVWAEIARVNRLSNPTIIHAGNKLQLPQIEKQGETKGGQKVSVPQGEKIAGDNYKIKKGDSLWTIAVRAYGDGYKWGEIAKSNKLTNPGVIHVDNTLKIPRK